MKPIPRNLFDAASSRLYRRRDRNSDPAGREHRALCIAYDVRWGNALAFVVDKAEARDYAAALRRVAGLARHAPLDDDRRAIARVLELAKSLEGGAK